MATIIVNKRHAGNDVVKHFKKCAFTVSADIEPDFVLGRNACALYLSMRFHAINPNYIYDRITALGKDYDLRLLLVIVDHIEYESFLKELSKLCIRCNLTLMLAWSVEDAAVYLERYKLSENAPAESIMGTSTNPDYEDALDQYMVDALAECKTVNRTDAATIIGLFDNFERICRASPQELALCPGVGTQKTTKLHNLLHRKIKKNTRTLQFSSQQSTSRDSQPILDDEAFHIDAANE